MFELFKGDIADWRITFVDTGLHSSIGERLRRVRRLVEDDEMFLANYADVFTDAPLSDMISRFAATDAAVSLLAVPLHSSHHVVGIGENGVITRVTPVRDLLQWENGGYSIMRPEIFDHIGRERISWRTRSRDWSREGRSSPTRTRATGRLPIRSRSAPRWRKCTTRATVRG